MRPEPTVFELNRVRRFGEPAYLLRDEIAFFFKVSVASVPRVLWRMLTLR
jgi:hypothetical protein